ncbi:hypothetical protein XENOCAPTIV_027454 [Xenoophorus captivus]|uniref:Uncharacterized protein n=1 Tax=Xenoophorus captivus TaxID=1517983 RepID=A0ABV0QTN7_9TELE
MRPVWQSTTLNCCLSAMKKPKRKEARKREMWGEKEKGREEEKNRGDGRTLPYGAPRRTKQAPPFTHAPPQKARSSQPQTANRSVERPQAYLHLLKCGVDACCCRVHLKRKTGGEEDLPLNQTQVYSIY